MVVPSEREEDSIDIHISPPEDWSYLDFMHLLYTLAQSLSHAFDTNTTRTLEMLQELHTQDIEPPERVR